jgi:hypothetical protein
MGVFVFDIKIALIVFFLLEFVFEFAFKKRRKKGL